MSSPPPQKMHSTYHRVHFLILGLRSFIKFLFHIQRFYYCTFHCFTTSNASRQIWITSHSSRYESFKKSDSFLLFHFQLLKNFHIRLLNFFGTLITIFLLMHLNVFFIRNTDLIVTVFNTGHLKKALLLQCQVFLFVIFSSSRL